MHHQSTLCMGYPLFNGTLADLALQEKVIITTINQYSYCIAEGDAGFKAALIESDVLLPDGVGMVLASRWLNHTTIKKIAGADLHQHVLARLEKEKGTCFYLGSSPATLEKIKQRMLKEFPNVRVGFYSPPYCAGFDEKDSREMIKAVNQFQPDVLFVGMTAPKQEKWVHQNKLLLHAKLIASVGAVFDFYAGTINRPSPIFIALKLEWLVRLIAEPKRMWKRYLYFGPVFLVIVLFKKIKMSADFGQTFSFKTKTFKISYPAISFKKETARG